MRMIALAACIAACTACGPDPDPSPGPAPSDKPFAEVTADGRLRIPEEALGRTLTLTRTLIMAGTNVDQINPMRTQIVHFERSAEGAIEMRESRGGSAMPAEGDRVLATFPAQKEEGGALVIDLDEGLKKSYVEFGVYQWWKDPKEVVADIVKGEVTDIRASGGFIVVERDETVSLPGKGEVPVGLVYSFSERKESPDFTPMPNNAVNGFYVNAPVPAAGGAEVMYAHRHATAAPIVYHVASDTPAERRAEIETSIGYWNGIFASIGKPDLLKIDTLPPEVSPLDPGRHTITWIPNPADGAGRAINTTDPLTGQILKTSVFVTSVFELQGEDAANTRFMIAKLDAGMAPSPLPETAKARAISDYYINTFTHEIGHSLGLRHNFAGNLTSSVNPKGYLTAFVTYLEGDLPEGAAPTSSVMEYVETPLAILVGAHIRLKKGALPYDEQAIRSMYGSGEVAFAPFCEQESADIFADCAEFDQGKDTLAGTYWQWESTIDEMAFRLGLAVATGTPLDAPDVAPELTALVLADPFARLSKHLAMDAEYLALRSGFPEEMSADDVAAYRAAVLDYQKKSYATLDGARAAFVADLVSGALDEARVKDLSAAVRARMEGYLALVGASADPAAMDSYFDALAKELGAALTPLLGVKYACFTC